jgi:phage-related protein
MIEKPERLRPIIWMGDSRKNILGFPEEVRKLIGDELQLIQLGGMPKDAKTFKGPGPGIIEITLKDDKEAYRCVQAVQLGEKIYVLHAFQKKSKRGIATPKKDVDLIKKCYKEAQELAKDENRENGY